MAIDFPTSPTAGQVYSYNGVTYVYTAQGVWATAGASAVGIIGGSPQGRLTLQTGTPVMTTTQSAKTTIYYTPYVGNRVPIYDGTNTVMTTFAELSVATTDTTKSPAAIGVSKVNDWFVWNDAGTIRLGHGPDWTNDTTRSAGTTLTMVNGILLNNAIITNGPAAQRGTYVGTTRSNASSQLDWIYGDIAVGGTAGFFGVWNAYNRVAVGSLTRDSTDTWAYTIATWRMANNSAGMRASYVCGLAEDNFWAMYEALGSNTTPTRFSCGVGFDTTSGFSGTTGNGTFASFNAIKGSTVAPPSLGFHFLQAVEYSNVSGTTTWGGDAGSADMQNGFSFHGRM